MIARSPALVWLVSVAGMALGLSIDCRSVSPAALASLCASGQGLGTLTRHFAAMPATNSGMALAMLATLVLSTPINGWALCRSLGCYAFMLVGMSLGGCVGTMLAGEATIAWGMPLMLAAMTLGMTAGMMVAEPLFRFQERGQAMLRCRRWPAAQSR